MIKLTPKQKNNAKIAAGVGIAALLLYFLTKKKKQDTGGSVTDPTGNSTNNPNVFNAAWVAEELYQAMKDFGTDENKIFTVLTNVSQTQFGQVVVAFGERNYNTFSGTTWGMKQPLKKWLVNELSSEEYSTLRLKYPNFL